MLLFPLYYIYQDQYFLRFFQIFFAATAPVRAMERLLLRAVSIMVLSIGYITLHFRSRILQTFPLFEGLWDTKLLLDIKVSPFHTFDDGTGSLF